MANLSDPQADTIGYISRIEQYIYASVRALFTFAGDIVLGQFAATYGKKKKIPVTYSRPGKARAGWDNLLLIGVPAYFILNCNKRWFRLPENGAKHRTATK